MRSMEETLYRQIKKHLNSEVSIPSGYIVRERKEQAQDHPKPPCPTPVGYDYQSQNATLIIYITPLFHIHDPIAKRLSASLGSLPSKLASSGVHHAFPEHVILFFELSDVLSSCCEHLSL